MTDFAIIKKDTKTIENIIVLQKENHAEFSQNFPDCYIIELEENDITSEDLYKQIENNYVVEEGDGRIRVLRQHLRDKTDAEIEETREQLKSFRLKETRAIRNSLLTQLDYKQLTMISQGTSTVELENDKDSLRDLPSNIVWPSDLNEISNYEPPLLNQIRTKYSIA